MAKVVLKRSKRPVIGSDGKQSWDVYIKGRYIDTITKKSDIKRIQKMSDQEDKINKKMSKY